MELFRNEKSLSCGALSDSDIGCHSMIQCSVFYQSNNVHASSVKAFAYPSKMHFLFLSAILFSQKGIVLRVGSSRSGFSYANVNKDTKPNKKDRSSTSLSRIG